MSGSVSLPSLNSSKPDIKSGELSCPERAAAVSQLNPVNDRRQPGTKKLEHG